jgi:SAM-dependent methyltransferase
MAEAVDYFSNHQAKLRFPWRLYHQPIVDRLAQMIRWAPGPNVLNVGSGPFFELEKLPQGEWRYTACDIDPRAVELARMNHGDRLERVDLLSVDAPLPYRDGAFDLVVAMDVIEHLPSPEPWLRELLRVLRPGGQLFLTTPNYGKTSLLPVIEATVLEVIARRQGFSRRHLHPTRFNRRTLRELLALCIPGGQTSVDEIAFNWVLAAKARKPAIS